MKNTMKFLMFLLIVSGMIFNFSACERGVRQPADSVSMMEMHDEMMSEFEDGIYVKRGHYESPAQTENLEVKVTLKNDVIEDVEVSSDTEIETSQNYQNLFIEGLDQVVVGKKISELDEVGHINGSSLTPQGFDDALAEIREEARQNL